MSVVSPHFMDCNIYNDDIYYSSTYNEQNNCWFNNPFIYKKQQHTNPSVTPFNAQAQAGESSWFVVLLPLSLQ